MLARLRARVVEVETREVGAPEAAEEELTAYELEQIDKLIDAADAAVARAAASSSPAASSSSSSAPAAPTLAATPEAALASLVPGGAPCDGAGSAACRRGEAAQEQGGCDVAHGLLGGAHSGTASARLLVDATPPRA